MLENSGMFCSARNHTVCLRVCVCAYESMGVQVGCVFVLRWEGEEVSV